MNKKLISNLFLTFLCFFLTHFAYASSALTCPSSDKIKAATVFIQAIEIPYPEIWAIISDTFTDADYDWNVMFRSHLPGIKDREAAKAQARKLLDQAALIIHPDIISEGKYNVCAYQPEGARYLVYAFNPPYYGPIP